MSRPDRVPGAERAFVAPGKAGYLLRAPGRATFFGEILGFEDEAALALELATLARMLPETPARFAFVNAVGREHWVAVMTVAGSARVAAIFTVWEVRADGRASFVTARPLRKHDGLLFE